MNPGFSIPSEATAVHRIGDADVRDSPRFEQILQEFRDFIGDHGPIAGYNTKRFDLPLLIEEFKRCGITLDLSNRPVIDSFEIYNKMDPRTLTGAAVRYLGQAFEGAHSAVDDVLAAAAVLDAQIARHADLPRNARELAKMFASPDLAGRFRFDNAGQVVFNFGKHRGRTLDEVTSKVPGYLIWLQNNEGTHDDVLALVHAALDRAADDLDEWIDAYNSGQRFK